MTIIYAVGVGIGMFLLGLAIRAMGTGKTPRVPGFELPEFITTRGVVMTLMVVGCVGLVFWAYNSPVGTAEAGSWAYQHWLAVLLAWGSGHVLVTLLEDKLHGAGTVLHWLLPVAAGMLFVVLPIIGWFNTPSPPRPKPAALEVPLASTPQSRWPKLEMGAYGRTEMISIPPGMRIVVAGNEIALHTVYIDGRECNSDDSGTCPAGQYQGSYVRNKAGRKNIAVYAFAPM